MTKDEIKALVAAKIAGQGSAIDAASVLPTILDGIVDTMQDITPATLTVKIHSSKWNDDDSEWEDDVEGAEGVLIVKGFDAFGKALPMREIAFVGEAEKSTINIEVPVSLGETIAVLAKVTDKGASSQLVTKIVGDATLEPEVFPAGLYELGDGVICPASAAGSDLYNGTVIVTEDFALLWPAYQRENADSIYLPWGPLFQNIPGMPGFASADDAVKDFDGALNTAAILSVVGSDSAAKVASAPTPSAQHYATGFFLPSAGMLKYLYDHKAEINAFIAAEAGVYEPETDYQLIPDDYLWSSSIKDAVFAWYVHLGYGYVKSRHRSYSLKVFAVSAFQTLY